MPRGAKRVLLIAGLSSLPSVSQRRDVWAEQKKEVNVVSGAPEKTKGENGQRFHVEYTTTGTKRTAIPMGTNKKEKKRETAERTILTLMARSLSPAFASMLRPR